MRKLKITEMNRLSVDEYKEKDKLPLIVILDDVRSLHNVGSVFRTSDAFLVKKTLSLWDNCCSASSGNAQDCARSRVFRRLGVCERCSGSR